MPGISMSRNATSTGQPCACARAARGVENSIGSQSGCTLRRARTRSLSAKGSSSTTIMFTGGLLPYRLGVGNADRRRRPRAGRACNLERAPASLGQSHAHVLDADVRAPVAAARQDVLVEAHAVVAHDDHVSLPVVERGDAHAPALFTRGHAVAHRVLGESLHGERRQLEVAMGDVELHAQPAAEPALFEAEVRRRVPQLALEGDGLLAGERGHVLAQKQREVSHGARRLGGVARAQLADGRQRVVQEVRLDLAQHDVEAPRPTLARAGRAAPCARTGCSKTPAGWPAPRLCS